MGIDGQPTVDFQNKEEEWTGVWEILNELGFETDPPFSTKISLGLRHSKAISATALEGYAEIKI